MAFSAAATNGNNSAVNTVTICEKSSQLISCASGVLSVASAVYGQSNSASCGGKNSSTATYPKCLPLDVTQQLARYCNGANTCNVSATNTWLGADPCPKYPKHLSIGYSCELCTLSIFTLDLNMLVVFVCQFQACGLCLRTNQRCLPCMWLDCIVRLQSLYQAQAGSFWSQQTINSTILISPIQLDYVEVLANVCRILLISLFPGFT
jgi:hypothetical protein